MLLFGMGAARSARAKGDLRARLGWCLEAPRYGWRDAAKSLRYEAGRRAQRPPPRRRGGGRGARMAGEWRRL